MSDAGLIIAAVPRPETIAEAIARWSVIQLAKVKLANARLSAKRPAGRAGQQRALTQPIESIPARPAPANVIDGIERATPPNEGLRPGENLITALKANQRATLVAQTWEAPGFWRWERSRRAYYSETKPGVVHRVAPSDAPHAFRPPAPLACSPPARPKPAEPDPRLPDVLDAFEKRILVALKVDQALRHYELDRMRVRAFPLQTRPGPGDYPPAIDTRFRPSRAELDDYEVVMRWFAKLKPHEQNVLWLISFGFSVRSIAERKRTNAAEIRRIRLAAVIACWRQRFAEQR